jgi:DTW domain-containing protein YfiP
LEDEKEDEAEQVEEEEDVDDDNSLDHEDELSVSVPYVGDGNQDGDGVGLERSQKHKRKRGTKRGKCADCWKYFKEITVASKKEMGKIVKKAKCLFCHRSYVYHTGGTTTTLNRHLKACTPFLNQLAKAKNEFAQGTHSFSPDCGSVIVNPSEYDHGHTRKLIAKMIVVHDYSFHMVEHKWFNILMKWINNNYESVSRKIVRNECIKVYETEKELLKKSLREVESIS